jgi:hypothetical protein
MRCPSGILLFAALLAATGAWAPTSLSQNIAITITPATRSVGLELASLTFPSQNMGARSAAQTITMTNTETVPFPLPSVAVTGTDAGDFSESNNCPSSLPVSTDCQIPVTFTSAVTATRTASVVASATGGGSYMVALSGSGTPPQPSAFYVATNGSDSNNGLSTSAPFATLGKCQSAMRGTSIKTCYIRAGTYTPPAITSNGNCVYGEAHGSSVSLTSADSGETWSYYPPDGIGSAIINGQSTQGQSGTGSHGPIVGGPANGTGCAFGDYQATGVTIIGLQFENYIWSAFWAHGANNLTFEDNIIHDLTGAAWTAGAVVPICSPRTTVTHNYMYNLAYTGIETEATNNCVRGNDNVTISNNVIINSCTWAAQPGGNDQDGGDCGAVYFFDSARTYSRNMLVSDNYIRDVNASSNGAGDFGNCCAQGVYLDNSSSNVTVTGNVVAGVESLCFIIGGGSNDIFENNICDLDNVAHGEIILWFSNTGNSGSCTTMRGDVFEHNIVVAGSTGSGGGFMGNANGSCVGTPPPAGSLTNQDNAYYNYVGSTISSTGTGGAPSDSNPTYENPQITCWGAMIAAGSPVFNSPVSFSLPSGWDTPGFWGPPGFTIPQTHTAPSWPHTC